jgi:putative ABC transport system permease protein
MLHYLRQAVRRLSRERAFSAAAVFTLALGIGASVAVFAVVEAVLLRPLPFADADDLVVIRHRDARTGITKPFIAIGDYVDLAAGQTAFAAFSAYGGGQGTVYGPDEAYQVRIVSGTVAFFTSLGLRPVVGRALSADDYGAGAAPVVLLGYGLWQQRFGGDSGVIGRSIRVGQRDRQVVGVAPRGFGYPPNVAADLITPLPIPLTAPDERKSEWVFALARLEPGQTLERANADLAAMSRRMETAFPRSNQGSVYYAEPLREALVGNVKTALMLLLGAVTAVLLIGCSNVANLLLTRALGRRREMAVRLALGAGRGRLAAQLLAESLVLAALAGIAGVAVAHWGARALVALIPASVSVPGLAEVRTNGAVLAFALALTVVTTLAFGLIGVATIRAEHASSALVTAGRASMSARARRFMSGLVAGEIAFAFILLIGAGLIMRSFAGLLAVDPGFRYDGIATVDIALPPDRYAEPEAREAFYQRGFEALRNLPGVQAAGAGVVVPLTGNNWTVGFERADQPLAAGERPPEVGWQLASGGFFTALRIPLLAGRLFDERDRVGSNPVVIVSEAIQRSYFGGESAVGRFIRLDQRSVEIVGVVGNIRRAGLTDAPREDLYLPFEQSPQSAVTLFVRTASDPTRSASSIRATLRRIEPRLVVRETGTMAQTADASVGVTRLVLWLLGLFAVTALVLAAVGTYAVMSYSVGYRAREIGTRMALGAVRNDILWMVMRQGAMLGAAGCAVGLLVGLMAARTLRSLLFGVTSGDPLVLGGAALTLVAATLAACYLPARRATTIDPARVLADS